VAILNGLSAADRVDRLPRCASHNYPIILLLKYAPILSETLHSQACLPNGDFLLPPTASIWNPAYFFTISIIVSPIDAYGGWTFTHAKIIDIVWDVTVGRGIR
jgi:hypothetical protein